MNENPEGTPNPLNPAPGTENDVAAGTGLDFVETEQVSEVMTDPETPAEPEAPAEPETPEVPEAPEMPEAPEVSTEPEAVELGKIEETSAKIGPASFTEAASFRAPTSPIKPVESETIVESDISVESESEPMKAEMPDPMMKPVSHSNFDTFGANDAKEVDVPVKEIKEETFVRSETPVTLTPASDTPELVAKDSIVEPAGGDGKKRVLIIGAIILVMIAIICGAVAVALMMNGNTEDRVTKAIDKLLNGEVSNIIAIDGDIAVNSSDSDNSVNINFDGTFDIKSTMSKVSANIDANIDSGTNLSFGIDEISNKSGDAFLKFTGLTDMAKNGNKLTTMEDTDVMVTNCVGDSSDLTNCQPQADISSMDILSIYGGLFEAVDNEWVEVSGGFAEAAENFDLFDNNSTCLINAFGSLPQYSKDIANKYKANPFITYSTDKLGITKKQNNLYRLNFNTDKLTAFINSLSNNGFINELNACANNGATNEDVASGMVEQIFEDFPTVYVEINEKYDFTRVYFETTVSAPSTTTTQPQCIQEPCEPETVVEETESTVTADLELSYPSELVIEEPSEYITMSDLLTNVMAKFLSNS